jgi:hypothetical protein
VVRGEKGKILDYEVYRMIRIQDHPKKSPIVEQIGRAVAIVVLERVRSDSGPPSAHSAKKQPRLHQLSF